MNPTLGNLSIDERLRLIEDLWDSIAAEQQSLPLTEEQKAELDLRLAAYEADGLKGRSAEAALADIRRRL